MEIQQIEQNVDSLLSACGFKKDGAEQPLRVLLHHLYSAVAMYKETSDSERAVIAKTNKKFRSIFELNFNLKERKRNNKAKEGLSPRPLFKEKENKKEIEQKNPPTAEREVSSRLEKRRQAFRKECLSYVGQYDTERLADFFNYWSEESHHAGKMRFEAQRFWNLQRRLARWMNIKYASEDTAAAIRLKKTKAKQGKEEQTSGQQQAIAAEREQANQEREAEVERSKAGAVSYEEWLRLRKR